MALSPTVGKGRYVMKLTKKIVAAIMSVMVFSSMSAITANAASGTLGSMSYSSYQYSAHQWTISTSYGYANHAVSCSGTGTYYTSTAKTTSTTGNGNGSSTSGTSANMYNNYGYGWKKCVSSHSATETGGSVISKTGWTVNGYYVY